MFLPGTYRMLVIGLYAYISWKFLSLGSIVVGAGFLAALEARAESLPLFPIGAAFVYVGVMALHRLRHAMDGRSPGL